MSTESKHNEVALATFYLKKHQHVNKAIMVTRMEAPTQTYYQAEASLPMASSFRGVHVR